MPNMIKTLSLKRKDLIPEVRIRSFRYLGKTFGQRSRRSAVHEASDTRRFFSLNPSFEAASMIMGTSDS